MRDRLKKGNIPIVTQQGQNYLVLEFGTSGEVLLGAGRVDSETDSQGILCTLYVLYRENYNLVGITSFCTG